MGRFSWPSGLRSGKAKQQRNNNLDNCLVSIPILFTFPALFQIQEPIQQNARCPPPPIEIPPIFPGKFKALVKRFAPKQKKPQPPEKESQGSPCTPSSRGFPPRIRRRSTGDSDGGDIYRRRRTRYSQMVSPTISTGGFQNSPSVDSPTTQTPTGSPGVEGIDSTYGRGPLGPEPTPETLPATTYEDRSLPLPLPKERGESPLIGLGIGALSANCEKQSSPLANPPSPRLTTPPAPKKRKERPAPVPKTWDHRGGFSWGFENCDTVSAATTATTPSSMNTGAAFAPARVQNVSKDRSTPGNPGEMPCTLEHCGGYGGDWNPSTIAATIVGSNMDSSTTLAASVHSQNEDRRPVSQGDFREMMSCAPGCCGRRGHGGDRGTAAATINRRDSGATLAASMHSESEGRPECKQRLGGAYCASKYCGRCQVGVENGLQSPANKWRVSWVVGRLVTALTKGVSWLRGK